MRVHTSGANARKKRSQCANWKRADQTSVSPPYRPFLACYTDVSEVWPLPRLVALAVPILSQCGKNNFSVHCNTLDSATSVYCNTLSNHHWKNSMAERTIFWSSKPENIAIRPMLRYGPQNYPSIGETAKVVFLNAILLREGYKFVDMTIRCIAIVTKILCLLQQCMQ